MYRNVYNNYIGVPSIVRADRGTENTTVAFLQPAFCHDGQDHHACSKSFQYGRSSANQVKKAILYCFTGSSCIIKQQRIEAWWSYLRRHLTEW